MGKDTGRKPGVRLFGRIRQSLRAQLGLIVLLSYLIPVLLLGVFAGVTLLRVLVNETRPYERYGQPSVFHKTTKGKSFPSRHTACAFIIGMTFLFIHVPSGIAALATALSTPGRASSAFLTRPSQWAQLMPSILMVFVISVSSFKLF